jgi:hypothetical protein
MNTWIALSISLILSCIYAFPQTNHRTDSNQSEMRIGLVFKNVSENRFEDSSYTDTIQLVNLKATVKAIQFKLLFNNSSDDSKILTFKSIEKGVDLSDQAWLLEYNILSGSSNSKDGSKDEIFVLLYNSNLKDGLIPGSYSSLLKINYEVIHLPKFSNNVKSSISISNAEAGSADGNKVNIMSKQNELKIFVKTK